MDFLSTLLAYASTTKSTICDGRIIVTVGRHENLTVGAGGNADAPARGADVVVNPGLNIKVGSGDNDNLSTCTHIARCG